MPGLMGDVRHAVRSLGRSPGFSAVAVLALGLGIAGNATLASIVSSLFLRPLPVPAPERLVAVYVADFSHSRFGAASYPDYLDLASGVPSLQGLTGMSLQQTSLSAGAGESRRILISVTAGDYFGTLQVPLALGRGFAPEELRVGGAPAVILSHALWQTRFGGRADILGTAVGLGGVPFTVVGVAPATFQGLLRGVAEDAWVPFAADQILRPGNPGITERGARGILLYGRLHPGRTLQQARAEADVVAARLYAAYPDFWGTLQGGGRAVTVLPESRVRVLPMVQGPALGVGALLAVLVGMVLLVVCANLANLVLARTSARRREFTVRLALGAGRGRVVRQLLVENLMLAGLGGAVGLAAAVWLCAAISRFRPPFPVTVAIEVHPDARVVLFILLVTAVAGGLLAFAPALQLSHFPLNTMLREGGLSAPRPRSRLRDLFVVLQVGLSLVLLIGAGLFLRSLKEAVSVDPGFETRQGLLLTLDLGVNRYSPERGAQFQNALVERMRAVPGVSNVALTSVLPLSLDGGRRSITVEGYHPLPGEDLEVSWSDVTPGYFETMRIAMAAGRTFGAADRAGGPGVIIVNQSFARRYWPEANPLGRRISIGGADGTFLEVVGVSRDGKYQSLGEEPTPYFYVPLGQNPSERFSLVATSMGDPRALEPAVREAVRLLDPALPIERVATIDEQIGASLLPARIAGALLGVLGLLALVLATLGIAGVVAFSVSQRVREIGVRVALGARGGEVVGMVVRQALRLVLVGGVAGLALAVPLSLLAARFLYGLSPLDPWTYVAVLGGFGAVSLAASWIPARRAAGVDPMVALRAE